MTKGIDKSNATLGWNNWVDRFFNEDFTYPFKTGVNPPANIEVTKDSYIVSLAVPGCKKEDLNVNVKNNMLIISAEEEHSSESEVKNFSKKEYSYKAFKRTFSLPDDAKDSEITAKYENGELILNIPKTVEEETITKTIKVG